MQQRGSKYDQKFKEEALALVASGVSITNAACRLRIPKSTLADWVHTQNESDEDGVAARRESDQMPLGALGEGEVLDALRRCQPDTLTPIEAMSLIYEWKQKLN